MGMVLVARLAAAEAELDAIAGVRGGRVRLASFPTAGASLLERSIRLDVHWEEIEVSAQKCSRKGTSSTIRGADEGDTHPGRLRASLSVAPMHGFAQ